MQELRVVPTFLSFASTVLSGEDDAVSKMWYINYPHVVEAVHTDVSQGTHAVASGTVAVRRTGVNPVVISRVVLCVLSVVWEKQPVDVEHTFENELRLDSV